MNEQRQIHNIRKELENQHGYKIPMADAAKALNISYSELSRRKHIKRFRLGKNIFFSPETIANEIGQAMAAG